KAFAEANLRVGIEIGRGMPTVLGLNITFDARSELARQFAIVDQHPYFGVQVRRSRIEIERADENGLVVDHHALGVQTEGRIVLGEARIFLGQLVPDGRIWIEFVYLDAGIEQIATLR